MRWEGLTVFSFFDAEGWHGFVAAVHGARTNATTLAKTQLRASGLAGAAGGVRQRMQERELVAQSRGASALLISYPKSGRTWLRYLISRYLNDVYALGETVTLTSMFRITPNWDLDPQRGLSAFGFADKPGVPLVASTHRSWRRSFERTGLPVLVMVRDPRDVMVSAYFHHTKHKGRLETDIASFLRRPDYGVADLVQYLNGVAGGVAGRRCLIVAYEQLSAEPVTTATAVIDFIGAKLHPALIADAVAASRFAAMREAEQATGIPGHDYDRADPDSLRMRKGVAGGWRGHLSADDSGFIEAECRRTLTPAAIAMLAGTGFGS